MLEARQLSIGFAQRELAHQVDFSVCRGQIAAVLGPNGRGKTTLIRTLLGLIPPLAGELTCPASYAYVPQQHPVPFAYDVLSMVSMGRARHLQWFQSPGRRDLEIARACLDEVQLSHLADRPFNALSGGQQQLVSIARALASESPLMVLDEPTAALDLRNQDLVLSMLQRLGQRRQLAIVFTTHQPQHALHIADQTMLMLPNACPFGPTAQMCTSERLTELYQLPVRVVELNLGQRRITGSIPLFSAPSQSHLDTETSA